MSHSVCLIQRRDLFFGDRWRDPHNLSCIQLVQQLMKLKIFICLTYHLSDNLKIQHKFSPATYYNQKFWFHLCYIHSSCPYNPLNKIICFALVNSTYVFQKRFYYRGFCWLCMRNSLADNVVLILMKFRNGQQYSN